MSGAYREKPYTAKQQTGKPPVACSKCKRAFDESVWPRSGWTLNGFSPWCPEHHADFAHDDFNRFNNRRKPGPKPKARGDAA